jgi:hypothetical protein
MVKIIPSDAPKFQPNIQLKGSPLKTQPVWGKNVISGSFMPTQVATQAFAVRTKSWVDTTPEQPNAEPVNSDGQF